MRTKIALLISGLLLPATLPAAGPPETVHIAYHVRVGRLDDAVKTVAEQYPACLKLGLVLAEPHLVMTGKESGGKPIIIEILRWRDGDAPDSIPEKYPQILAIWNRLNALVEKRDGKPGIEIDPVEVVGEAPAH